MKLIASALQLPARPVLIESEVKSIKSRLWVRPITKTNPIKFQLHCGEDAQPEENFLH